LNRKTIETLEGKNGKAIAKVVVKVGQ